MYLNFPHIDFGISISHPPPKKLNDYIDFQFNGIPQIFANLLLCVMNYTYLKYN